MALLLERCDNRSKETLKASLLILPFNTEKEAKHMVSQNVTPSMKVFGGSFPYAFTEQGVAMLSSVLKSKRARLINIQIMRAFVRMRQALIAHAEILEKIGLIESKLIEHDANIAIIFDKIREMLSTPSSSKKIGFLR